MTKEIADAIRATFGSCCDGDTYARMEAVIDAAIHAAIQGAREEAQAEIARLTAALAAEQDKVLTVSRDRTVISARLTDARHVIGLMEHAAAGVQVALAAAQAEVERLRADRDGWRSSDNEARAFLRTVKVHAAEDLAELKAERDAATERVEGFKAERDALLTKIEELKTEMIKKISEAYKDGYNQGQWAEQDRHDL